MIHQNLCISLLLGDVLLLVASYGINKFQVKYSLNNYMDLLIRTDYSTIVKWSEDLLSIRSNLQACFE